jgi:hypothetical protein
VGVWCCECVLVFVDVCGGLSVVCGVDGGEVGCGDFVLGGFEGGFTDRVLLVFIVSVVGESEGVNPQNSHCMFASRA